MRKIDVHCHTTKSTLRKIIPAAATLDVIEKEMRLHDIEYTIMLATYFPKEGKGISNYRLLHWLKGNPAFKLFGSLDFQYFFLSGLREITELAEEGNLSGIKIYSGYQDINFASEKFYQVAKLAEKYNLPLMFHGGYLQCHESNSNLAISPREIAEVAHRHPNIHIIISHLAWPFIHELIEVVLHYENVFADMSGMLDSFKTPHTFHDCVDGIKRFLGQCGSQKLLFGTDFPIQTHTDSIKLIEESMIEYPDVDKENVYYNNAKILLNID